MPTDAFEMAIVHRVFRNELRNAPGLIREVEAGDTERSAIVGGHLDFIAAALHRHHAAEDELIWPKLHARAPARAAEITRMEGAHRGIADSVATVQAMLPSWATSADARQAGQLVPAVESCRPWSTSTSRTKNETSFRSSPNTSRPTSGRRLSIAERRSCPGRT